jgi:hypothetical protein
VAWLRLGLVWGELVGAGVGWAVLGALFGGSLAGYARGHVGSWWWADDL